LHGVREYWIVDPEKEQVEIHLLKDKAFYLEELVNSGFVRSAIISGFQVPVRALFDDDQANDALRALLAS